MDQGHDQTGGRVTALGKVSLDGLGLITKGNDDQSGRSEDSFGEQMSKLKAGATKSIGTISGDHVKQASRRGTEGPASMDKAVAGFDTALATIGGKVDGAIDASLQALDKDLKGKLGELDGQIAREAWKAAEQEQPAWKSVVAIILIVLVIIAATVISIVTLGAGASLFAVILGRRAALGRSAAG